MVKFSSHNSGDMICTECGLVVGDRVIDVSSEWRTFSNDKESKDMCRVGDVENRLLSSADLSTMIGPSGRGFYLKFVTFEIKRFTIRIKFFTLFSQIL